MAYYNPDDFRISKSYVTMDIDNFIQSAMGMPDNEPSQTMMTHFVDKNHNFNDFEGQQSNPYEEEAVEMAIRKGVIDEATGRIIHAGPNAPGYENARKEALRKGKPLVNQAARNQNELNKGIWPEVPLPFMENGQDASSWPLHQAYIDGESATLKEQTRDFEGRPRKGPTAFNPWKNGKIVTNLMSSSNTDRKGEGTFQEGWARWYQHGAIKDNLIEQRHSKAGKVINSATYRIPAHYVHKNVMHLNDRGHTQQAVNYVKQLQETYPNMSHDEIKRSLLNQDFMFANSHHSFHNYDSVHGRIDRKLSDNKEIRDGNAQPNDDDLETGRDAEPLNSISADNSIFHPESRIGELIGRGRGVLPLSTDKIDKTFNRHMKKYYDMDDEQVYQMITDVLAGRKSNGHKYRGSTAKERLANALYEHEMDRHGGNLPPDHHYTGPTIPVEGRGFTPPPIENTGGTGTAPPDTRGNPLGIPGNLPTIDTEHPELPRVTGGYVPPATLPVARPNIPNIHTDPNVVNALRNKNANIPLNVRSNVMGPSGDTNSSNRSSSFAALLANHRRKIFPNAGVGDSFLDNENNSSTLKSEIEEYIEDVQLQLAKTVIDDLHNIRKMDLDSNYDITILASQIQRPTNDIISIYHTRGDWRNIAKSFGIEHRHVQLIKVALHE